ncbi:MAG TPA: dihydrofolate synthase [Actinobacteria bacterium]|nr:dihydrofolate synthase [Actinomycetota bacterium]
MPVDDSAGDLPALWTRLEARWPEHIIEPTLARIAALTDLLGTPQSSFPVIHVTGTNGKTSTARMIESLLRAYGLRTGLFTSPHLVDARERICLDAEPIGEEALLAAWSEVAPYVDVVDANSAADGGAPLSYFEVMTGLALAAFADAPVDVAVIEVGMGGGWDSTNVVHGAVSVITPIGLDHREYLGDTIELIAGEKAGIIKPGCITVLAQQELAAAEVLLERAVEVDATVAREGVEFGVLSRGVAVGGQVLRLKGLTGEYDEVFLPLFGEHQAHNAAVALAATEAFLGGVGMLDIDIVREGFAAVTSPGRLEVLRRGPAVIVDAAHNPHGAHALALALQDSFDFVHLVGVVGVLAEKDALGILTALQPVLDRIVVTSPTSPRAMDADTLAALAVEVFSEDRVFVEPELPEAIDRALALAEEAGVYEGAGVLVTGSVVLVGEVRRMLGTSSGGTV